LQSVLDRIREHGLPAAVFFDCKTNAAAAANQQKKIAKNNLRETITILKISQIRQLPGYKVTDLIINDYRGVRGDPAR